MGSKSHDGRSAGTFLQTRRSVATQPRENRSRTGPRRRWLVPLLAVAALVMIIVVRYRQQDTSTRPAADADQAATAEKVIQLEIDFGDGAEKRFTKLPWHADMTVADAMELAAAHPRGIRYTLVGAGPNALLV